ncbi:hypothetical protein ACQYZY_28670 [Pseudomonas aeruginosa]|jgi:nitrous oxide reductase accessory protein NosL|nr:hypothetical protein [Pseudomonas aeruginosa]
MKNFILALAALTILAGCDAASDKEPSPAPVETPRKTDDAQQF